MPTTELDRLLNKRGLTYNPGSEASFFADAYLARHRQDEDAQRRLAAHEAEMRVEIPAFEQRMRSEQPEGVSFIESRAPTATFANPPLWLVAMTALLPRPERVLAGLVPRYTLPDGIALVGVPRLTSGTAVQTTTPGQPYIDSLTYTDAAVTSNVPLIAGNADVPLAMIELSGRLGAAYDQLLYQDLLNAFDAQLEYQLLVGAGGTAAGSPLLGVAEVPGVNEITYTTASPTAMTAYGYVGQLLGSVADARKARPTALLMRYGRWIWFVTSEDEQGRPYGVPDAHTTPPETPNGVPDPVGALVNVPVFNSEAIPANYGTTPAFTGNQDLIIACRPSDMPLWIGTPKLSLFEDVLSSTLEARVQLRRSAAFIPHRYPQSISVLSGTGLVVSTDE